jgi:hypothetical protein
MRDREICDLLPIAKGEGRKSKQYRSAFAQLLDGA